MKKFILISLILFLSFPAGAVTLEGGVKFDINTARRTLMETPDRKIDSNLVQTHFIDKYYSENTKYLYQGKAELKDRVLAFFSDKTYAVMYNDNPLYVWYYSSYGNLIYAEKKNRSEYPYKTYKYTPDGRLVNMSLRVSKGETFIYTPDGTLLAHWVGANAFDENGNIIMTRKYYE